MTDHKTESGILYTSISDYLREKIYSQEWAPGYRIPSENELREMFSVSRGTVRRAISELSEAGLVERVRGSGTFVTGSHLTHLGGNRPISFAASLRKQGIQFETHVIEKDTMPASELVADHLMISEGDPVLKLVRVRTVDGEPVMTLMSWLPLDVCPGLDKLSFESMSVFDAVERTSKRHIHASHMTYSARVAGKEAGELLQINEKMPILSVKQVIRLEDGTPIEWSTTLLNAGQTVVTEGVQESDHLIG